MTSIRTLLLLALCATALLFSGCMSARPNKPQPAEQTTLFELKKDGMIPLEYAPQQYSKDTGKEQKPDPYIKGATPSLPIPEDRDLGAGADKETLKPAK